MKESLGVLGYLLKLTTKLSQSASYACRILGVMDLVFTHKAFLGL